MRVERTNSEALAVNKLPDGSYVIVDQVSDTVFALNAAAGAAWDACNHVTTLTLVTEEMKRSFDVRATEELAHEALAQLEAQNLVKMTPSVPLSSRRSFIGQLGAAAVPIVIAMSATEQRAHAQTARSVVSPTPQPQPLPIPPLPPPISNLPLPPLPPLTPPK
jgi:hypothetical protein